MVVLK